MLNDSQTLLGMRHADLNLSRKPEEIAISAYANAISVQCPKVECVHATTVNPTRQVVLECEGRHFSKSVIKGGKEGHGLFQLPYRRTNKRVLTRSKRRVENKYFCRRTACAKSSSEFR